MTDTMVNAINPKRLVVFYRLYIIISSCQIDAWLCVTFSHAICINHICVVSCFPFPQWMRERFGVRIISSSLLKWHLVNRAFKSVSLLPAVRKVPSRHQAMHVYIQMNLITQIPQAGKAIGNIAVLQPQKIRRQDRRISLDSPSIYVLKYDAPLVTISLYSINDLVEIFFKLFSDRFIVYLSSVDTPECRSFIHLNHPLLRSSPLGTIRYYVMERS